jgi:hypothetical protein
MRTIEGNNDYALLIENNNIDVKYMPVGVTVITNHDEIGGDVQICVDEDDLNYKIARLTTAPELPVIGEWCEKDKVYNYGDKLVKCIQGHNRMHFAPEETPALFNIIPKVSATEYPVWKQPAGGHDAYAIGDKVHFPTITDPVYESKINANVWSPTVYPAGWKKL